MIKRISALVLSVVMLSSMVACSDSSEKDTETTEASKATEATEAAETTEDKVQDVNWPTDAIKIFVAGAAGSNMDLKARIVAKYLGDELGQGVVIENVAGAGGITGCTQYLSEKPNTNNIMLMAGSYLGVLPIYNDCEFKSDDYTTVCGLDTVENGFFVSAKTGVKTLDELKEYGKDKTIKFAAGGAGNDTYLMTKVTLNALGLKSDMVTGKGFAEGLVNCSTGVVDVMYCALNQAKQYVEDGSIIPLGVYCEKAFKAYADVGYDSIPTLSEQGVDATYSTFSYFAIRSGTDEAIVNKLANALQNVYNNSDFKKEFDEAGFVMMADTSKDATEKAVNDLMDRMNGYGDIAG